MHRKRSGQTDASRGHARRAMACWCCCWYPSPLAACPAMIYAADPPTALPHTHTHTRTQHTTHTHDTSARPFRPPPQAHERARSPPPTRTDDTRCGGAARSPPCPAPPRFLGCRMAPATSRIGPRAPAPMPATLTHRWPHVLLLRLLRHAGRVEGARRGRPSQQSRHTAAQPASPFSLPTPSQRPLLFPTRASSTAAAAARDRDRALRRGRRPFSAAAASTA